MVSTPLSVFRKHPHQLESNHSSLLNTSFIEDPVEEIDDKGDLHSLLNYALDSENENGDLEVSIEKQYSCVLCSKSLSSEKQLKNHRYDGRAFEPS